jgi:hypothetical protein
VSEVESQAIFDFAETIFPDSQKVRGGTVAEAEENIDMACGVDVSGVYLDLHSYGGFVVYPWSFADNVLPDDVELQTMARKLASEVFPINYEALIYAAKVASAPFKIPKGPDVLSLEVESTTSNSVTVTVLVSDEERSSYCLW